MAAQTHCSYSKLDRSNFRSWKSDITCHLQAEGLSKWIEKKTQPELPENPTFSEILKWDQLKEKTLGLIKGACTAETRQIIEASDDPAVAWEMLKKAFEAPSRARKAHTLSEYLDVRMSPEEPMSLFIARYEAAYLRLQEAGEEIPETQRCYQLIRYLPESYDGLVRELYNLDDNEFTYKEVKERLLCEYGRTIIKKEEELTQDSFMTNTSKLKTKSSEKSLLRTKKFTCFKCGQSGHIARNCFRKLPGEDQRDRSCSQRKPVIRKGTSCLADVEVQGEAYYAGSKQQTRDWTIDSATTAHICQNQEFFVYMKKPSGEPIVRMGITPHKVEGIGRVEFHVKDQGKIELIILNDVLYVPSINRNLVSMSRMEDAGLHATLERGIKIFNRKWEYLFTARRIDQFYILKGIPKRKVHEGNNTLNDHDGKNFSFAADMNYLMLWHERFGHCNVKTLKLMFQKNMINGMEKLSGSEEICEFCRLAKSTRAPHPRLQGIRSTKLLQLIHADVWGPAPVDSLSGYRYILTFIDDFSRRSFCFPLKTKDEVIEKFKEFLALVERQTNHKVCAMRSDNGLEFCNSRIDCLLKSKGIRHERTNTYSPQMNGVAERYNRTLLEGVRAHLQSTRLPLYHWIESVMSMNYLRNRTLHAGIQDIPFRRWYGKKPNVRHFKRLGCRAFVHQPKNKRNKFEARSKKGVLVGYGLGTRGYRIWYPKENLIVESKHVTIDEKNLGVEDDAREFSINQQVQVIPNDWELDWERVTVEQERPAIHKDLKRDESLEGNNIPSDVMKGRIRFTRTWKERHTGKSKGRLDIYYKTPDGETLRSRNEIKKYCELHKLTYEEDKFNFCITNKTLDSVTLEAEPVGDNITSNEEEENLDEEECSCGEVLGEIYCTDIKIPRTVSQAISSPEANHWKKAMEQEIKNMEDRNVWTLVRRTKDVKVIGSRWVFNLKRNASGHISSYKARLVALGNNQTEGTDYEETYSPVVNFMLIRLFIIIFIVILGWSHGVLDVKCAYLYGKVDKELYMKQPTGYEIKGNEDCVLKLHKSIYGLHQSGRCWYKELHEKLLSIGFKEIPGMVCVYHYKGKAVIQVYVDDIPIYAKSDEILEEVVNLIKSIYDVKYLGPLKELLGVKFNCSKKYAFINQSDYIDKCAKRFNCELFTKTYVPITPGIIPTKSECPKSEEEKERMRSIPYRSLLGCLMFIASRSRPDVAYSVASLSQFCENPGKSHWDKLKNILCYLKSSKDLGIEYLNQEQSMQMTAYVDASWAADPDHRRSWSGYCILLNGSPFAWRVSKQTCVAQSPMEAEFIAMSDVAKEVKYVTTVFLQLESIFDFKIQKPMVYCDSSSAIQFTRNRIQNISTRYIDLKYMFVRDLYEKNVFEINHVLSKSNVADLFTKPLKRFQFEYLRSYLLS